MIGQQKKKKIQSRFISSKDQLAEVLTKPLSYSIFALLRSKHHMDTSPLA